MQGLHNMLANESLFLPTVNSAIDFLPIAHIADYALKGDWLPWLLKIAGNPTCRALTDKSGVSSHLIARRETCLRKRSEI
jgi:hypothetical protein